MATTMPRSINRVNDDDPFAGLRALANHLRINDIRPDPRKGYWYTKMPVSRQFVNEEASGEQQREFVQAVLDIRGRVGAALARRGDTVRVTALIRIPDLFDAQIVVFFDEEAYASFIVRDNAWHRWTRLPAGRDLVREWALRSSSPRIGFAEAIRDEDFSYDGEVWLIGDVDDGEA